MSDIWSKISSGQLIWIVAIGGGLLWGIVCSVGKHWERIRKVELKQDMLNRGMTAEEIKTVLDAGNVN
jgi:hypothetical protein